MELYHCIAIDPGSVKCGVAVVDMKGRRLWQQVVPRAELLSVLHTLHEKYAGAVTILGNGTASEHISDEMEATGYVKQFGPPIVVDEYGSTEEARRLYLTVNRRGWRRWWPLGLQTPPEPVDDYVAVVLALRYITSRFGREPH